MRGSWLAAAGACGSCGLAAGALGAEKNLVSVRARRDWRLGGRRAERPPPDVSLLMAINRPTPVGKADCGIASASGRAVAIRANNSCDRMRRQAATSVMGLIPMVLGGFLMAAAVFSSSEFPWLGWFALIPLLRAVQVQSPLAASISGGVWGLSIALFTRWLGQSEFASSVSGVVVLSLLPGLYAYVGARVTRRVGFNPLVLAVGWMPIELVLQPLGLQHGLLASTQGDGALARLVGQLFGYVVVAFVLAFFSAALLAMLSGLRWRLPRFRSLGRIEPTDGIIPIPVWILAFLTPITPSQPRAPPCSVF